MTDIKIKYKKRAYKEFESNIEKLGLSTETTNILCDRLKKRLDLVDISLDGYGDKSIIKNEYSAVSKKYLYEIIIELKSLDEIIKLINSTNSKLLYKDNPVVLDNIIKFKDDKEKMLLYILKARNYTGNDIIRLLYRKRGINMDVSRPSYTDANKDINEKRRNMSDE